MGAQLGGGSGPVADINMTPLIDIVLVVLIIMMVNIPIQVEKMGVKLPSNTEVRTTPPPDKVEQLVLAMYDDGRYALNKRVMDEETLFAEITRRLRPMDKKLVFLDAHPAIDYGTVVDMVDFAKEAGAEKVAFAKLKPEGPAAPTSVAEGGMPRGVYPGSPGVVGAMTEKKADEQFKPMEGQIRACYNEALGRNPKLSGRLIIRVDVGPQGEIMDSGIISSTMEDEELDTCILEKIPLALRYEALGEQKTARVHYPFLFSAG